MLCLAACAGCGGTARTSSSPPKARRAPVAYATPSAPIFAQNVRLRPVSGRVRISVPGSAAAPLTGTRLVPVGSLVDTNAGAVELTSATTAPTRFQSGEFHGGMFVIMQSRAQGALVNLVIRDNLSRGQACAVRARSSQRILGLLRGNARGRFRTTGRFAAGTVRGTEWGVRDRCDGTLVLVQRGTVVVRDFRLGKNIVVHAGRTYLAGAP